MKRRRDESGWTLATLCTHVMALLAEKDKRDQQRYDAQTKALDAALLTAKEAVQAALQAAKEAVTKQELAAEKRFELLNELRSGVATTEQIDALEKVVSTLAARLDRSEGKGSGLQAGWSYLVAAVGLVVGLVGIYLALSR